MFPCGDAEIPVKIQVNLLARLDRCCRELLRLTAAKGSKGTTRQQPARTSFAWLVNCSPPHVNDTTADHSTCHSRKITGAHNNSHSSKRESELG